MTGTKTTGLVLAFLLAAYSAALVVCELSTSQAYVRHFVTDIAGPVPFYAVNTTLSVSLLWAAALLFAVCIATLRPGASDGRPRRFYASQVLMFLYLGLDDRFHIHEVIGEHLGIDDHYVLVAVAVVEVVLLVRLGGRAVLRHPSSAYMYLGAACFAVMLWFDALVPHDMVLRLTVEDLAKTWGGFFFFLWAWRHLAVRLDRLKATAAEGSEA